MPGTLPAKKRPKLGKIPQTAMNRLMDRKLTRQRFQRMLLNQRKKQSLRQQTMQPVGMTKRPDGFARVLL